MANGFGADFSGQLAGFRSQFPQYGDMDDVTLLNSLRQKHYKDLTIEQIAGAIGQKYGSGQTAAAPQKGVAAAASTYDVGTQGRERVGKGASDAEMLLKPLVPVAGLLPERPSATDLEVAFAATPLRALTPKGKRLAYGLMRGTTQFAEGMTSPVMLALVAGTGGMAVAARGGGAGIKALSTAISAGFAADMAHNAGKDAVALRDAIKRKDNQEVGERLASMVIGGAFAVGAGTHAYKTGRAAYGRYKLDRLGVTPEGMKLLQEQVKNYEQRVKVGKPKVEETPKPKGKSVAQEKAEFWQQFDDLAYKVSKAEKTPGREMNPQELELWNQDWKEYSRSKGYTEQEIADYQRYLDMVDEGQKRYGVELEDLESMQKVINKRLADERAVPAADFQVRPEDYDLMINQLEKSDFTRGANWAQSGAPEWFQRMNRDVPLGDKLGKADVLPVLRKMRDGKPLTEKQQIVWDRVRGEYEYWVNAERARVGGGGTPEREAAPEMTGEAEVSPWDKAGGDLFGEAPRAKQPWEMTRDEFEKEYVPVSRVTEADLPARPYGDKNEIWMLTGHDGHAEQYMADFGPLGDWKNPKVIKGYIPKSIVDEPIKLNQSGNAIAIPFENFKKDFIEVNKYTDIIEKALAEGRPVPPEVLKDYPDLAAQYSKQGGVQASEKVIDGPTGPQAVNREAIQDAGTSADEYFAGLAHRPQVEAAGAVNMNAPIGPPVKMVSRAEIRAYLDKEFDVPIWQGRHTGLRQKSRLGVYSPHDEMVMERWWGDIYTESHEVAHHLDKKLGITRDLKAFSKVLKDELGRLDYYPERKRANEGFAEFIRHDLTIGDAHRLAPNFYQHWQLQLAKDPALKAKYETARDMFRRYHEQGADARVDSQIDMVNARDPQSIPQRLRKTGLWLQRKFIDNLKPLDVVAKEALKKTGRTLTPENDPFKLATYLKGTARAKAEAWVFKNVRDVWGDRIGKPLEAILEPVRGQITDFIRYVVARRALVLADREINIGVELADAEYVFRKWDSPQFRKVSDEMMAWAEHGLDYLVDAGGLSPEGKAQIRALNPFYAAMKKHFPGEPGGVAGGTGKGLTEVPGAIKRIRGGGQPIVNPLEGMVAEVYKLILAADKIRVARAVANLSNLEGMGRLLVKVAPPMEMKQTKVGNLKGQLEAAGVDLSNADMEAMLQVFTPGWSYHGKGNVISVWRDGKREFFKVNPELYEALAGLEAYQLPAIFDATFGRVNRFIRLMTTGINAGFGLIRNPQRDIVSSAVYTSGNPWTAPARAVKGVIADIKNLPEAARFKELGGEMSTLMGQDREATMGIVDRLLTENGTFKGKAIRVMRHPVDALRQVIQLTEMGPRIAEYEAVMKKAEAKYGEGSSDAQIEAFNAARNVTINFSRNGTYGAVLNQIIPFWNAALQGGVRMVEFARQHPVKFAVRGMSITVPSVMLWMINRDKDWYKDLPLAYKYNNWFIELDDKTILRIPKPFELGVVFGGFFEAALDQATGIDDKAVNEALALMWANMVPSMWPAAVAPAKEVMQNKDWLDRPIETESMRRMGKEERYKETTSELAKHMTRGMQEIMPDDFILSPVQIDHLLNGYTGGQYRSVQGIGRKMAAPNDIPIVGTLFLRAGTGPRRQVDKSYQIAQKVEQAVNTIRMYEKRGDKVTADQIRARHPEVKYWDGIRRETKAMTELLRSRKAFEKNAAKVEAIDSEIRSKAAIIYNLYKIGLTGKG
jgi:hypothetical protein